MKPRVFLPYRKRKGKRVRGSVYHLRFKLAGDAKPSEVSLRTTDERVAQQRAAEIVREAEHERAGYLPPKLMRESVTRPLVEHLAEYVAESRARGRAKDHVYNVNCLIKRLIADCGWETVRDVTAESFGAWLSAQDKAPKTLNEYLGVMRALLAWMCKRGRLAANPLREVEPLSTRGRQRRPRRALTLEEMTRLIEAAPRERRSAYLFAVHTGLRRSEIAGLTWGRVHLNAPMPFVTARASTTKNRDEAVLPLHADLVAQLRECCDGARENDLVVPHVPSVAELKVDLAEAGIEFEDGEGRRVDFHALRTTCGTNLARAGVAPRVAMAFMRHSDMRLTNSTYTDAKLLPVAGVVEQMPSFMARGDECLAATGTDDAGGTQKRSSITVSSGQVVARGDARGMTTRSANYSSGPAKKHELAGCGTNVRESCESRGSRIRT